MNPCTHTISFLAGILLMTSKFLQGIEYPTPRVDGFMADIFNHDSELVDYARKLYGYALNGRTHEEIFVLLLGAGGKGPSRLSTFLWRRSLGHINVCTPL
jgi:hypothetical protein